MNIKNTVYQKPCPIVKIVNPDTKKELVFNPETKTALGQKHLLSYNFTLSTNDISGSFTLTFFPDYIENGMVKSLFDDIKKLSIVYIYEGENRPVFTGIIHKKKYVAQTTDGGGTRRMSVTGTAITGLISQFYINLDPSACAMTKTLTTQADLIKKLTLENAGENKPVEEVIEAIWNCFYQISEQLGTPKIAEYINTYAGGIKSMLDVDESKFAYSIGCVFNGEQTQDFFSLIEILIPSPVYEKFAYMDSNGKMRIKIRIVPFSQSNWNGLKSRTLNATVIKSFDFEESDDEVYTAFYAYLNGSPIDEQKSLVLSTMEGGKVDEVLKHTDLFKTYGYRPMIAHFIGYGVKDGEKDKNTTSNMAEMSENLKKWYERVHEMLKGSVTLSMTYDENGLIQPGEKIKFLGGEFYVEGVSHSWNYNSGGEINLSVSRGGKYNGGNFTGSISNLTSLIELLQRGGGD